ncbi:hypothetical protein KBB96_11865 [Luteolibacter ambystomatis]|uniref:DUF4402 domain-containing protein n=1 Tax=Luteolibacter ambystomatis TaxID=2824561 RepID=A0A975G778_9BACT|nr:hypothetical protein [Luteolibacter ambystomatis]QUE49570.1 hypothetical protein KBB96_11865 [Luteolibacter ambystomatis]
MKRIKLLSVVLLSGVLAAVPMFSAAEAEASKPVEKKDGRAARRITVKLFGANGASISDATVSAVEVDSQLRATATVTTVNGLRRIVEITCSGPIFQATVTEPDRAPSTNKLDGKGLAAGDPLVLFRVSSLYAGPGEYEVYRGMGERMVITVQ